MIFQFILRINDLPHLNTRVNTDNYFENLLEDEDFYLGNLIGNIKI